MENKQAKCIPVSYVVTTTTEHDNRTDHTDFWGGKKKMKLFLYKSIFRPNPRVRVPVY